MKIKLWRVHFKNQNPSYFGDHDEITIQAPNAKCAMDKAIKHFEGITCRRLQEIDEVELIGKAEN